MDIFPGFGTAPDCTQTTSVITEAYASGAENQLDLYRPTNIAGPFATVIWIHGGGWSSGSRADVAFARRLVCRGYAVASIDYRLTSTPVSPPQIFPAQIYDVKAAIRYLRAHAGRLNLNPNLFATFGSSAGGHLSALAATSAGMAALEDLSMGNPGASSAVQAGVDWFGPTDFLQVDAQLAAQGCSPATPSNSGPGSAGSRLLGCTVSDATCAAAVQAVNPITYVGANTPPMLIIDGTADCVVPLAQSDLLKAAMDAAGRCAIRRNVVGAGHGGSEWLTSPVQVVVAEFLDTVRR